MALDWNILLRPRSWDDVLGQTHIKTIMQQSITNKNFPKFSIFAGPSGTGKSAVAELCAMALACKSKSADPCMKCSSCERFLNGHSTTIKKYNMAKLIGKRDVIPVLEEIFEYESLEGISIYILEEVHVLSDSDQSPFLEELTRIPDDVYIIMCTTQPWKLLPEIRNRAITFQIETPTTNQCIQFISDICKKIGVAAPSKETMRMISELCENTPRKIVSTLELFSQSAMTNETISDFFGFAGDKVYIDLLDNLCMNKSLMDYTCFIESISDTKTSTTKIVKGLESFMTTVLLSMSNKTKLKLIPESDRLVSIMGNLTEERFMQILDMISDMNKHALTSEASAKFFLIQMKIKLLRSAGALDSSQSRAVSTALRVNQMAAHKENRDNTGSSSGVAVKDFNKVTLESLQAVGTSLFTEEEDNDE